jgi:hypothetical protein
MVFRGRRWLRGAEAEDFLMFIKCDESVYESIDEQSQRRR